MKYIYNLFLLTILGLGSFSCQDDETSDISQITYYANIELEGDSYLVLQAGDTYEEAGAIAIAGDETLEVSISGDVDTNTPGVYVVTYSAMNDDGYSSSKSRTILVTSEDISDVDLAGEYQGSGFGNQVATVTKLGEGYYFCNKGLASSNNVPIYFYHLGGDEIVVPGNSSNFGWVESASATLTADGFEWLLNVECCGQFGPIKYVKL